MERQDGGGVVVFARQRRAHIVEAVGHHFAQLPGCGPDAGFLYSYHPWKLGGIAGGAGGRKTGAGIGTALPKVGLRRNLPLQRVLGRGVRWIDGGSLLVSNPIQDQQREPHLAGLSTLAAFLQREVVTQPVASLCRTILVPGIHA